jgi:hypothetical protein
MNRLNKLLPEPEKLGIEGDDKKNLDDIYTQLQNLNNSEDEILDGKALGTLIRLIRTRKVLKYEVNASYFETLLPVLNRLYINKKLSYVTKNRIIQLMTDLCENRKLFNTFKYDWKRYWDDTITVATRSRKTESIASAEIVVTFLSKISQFLTKARYFLSDDEADNVIKLAMEKLGDLRQMGCTEGLLLLLTCLPSSYSKYQEILPKWIEIWTSIEQNAAWDACWLTVISRARKYTPNYPWSSLTGLLLMKTRELLHLESNGEHNHDGNFPSGIFDYYLKIANFKHSARQTALGEISKLLYHIACQAVDPITTHPLTITPPKIDEDSIFTQLNEKYPGFNTSGEVSKSTSEISMFFQGLRHFIYPSNSGSHSPLIAQMMQVLISEMAKHVGRELSQILFDTSKVEEVSKIYRCKLHSPTVQYLCGIFTIISIEGLFNRDQSTSFSHAADLKNLLTIDPQLAHIILPVLIKALTRVNQSHQAPVALYTLNLCLRHLVYPTPIIIGYLPSILCNAIPGLDPNDTKKTVMTLSLLCSIFSWIPFTSNYVISQNTLSFLPPYLSLIHSANGSNNKDMLVKFTNKSNDDLKREYQTLSLYLPEFIDSFLDKFFALLDAQSLKQPGKGLMQKMMNGAIPSMCECIGYLFQNVASLDLRSQIQTKILDYFRHNSPINAVKVCGKIFEYMIQSLPSSLPTILSSLLDSDTELSGNISPDKLAFKLRLIGGAVREATQVSILQILSKIKPYTEITYTQHAEKPMRKAANKLLKVKTISISNFVQYLHLNILLI